MAGVQECHEFLVFPRVDWFFSQKPAVAGDILPMD
jgi:hypothetical protein